jgi:outer membrane protein assembly factor BamD (BamD/ComL family)
MGEGSYFNFDLIVERAGEKYRARVFDSPAGQASAEFELPFSGLELENFVLRMGRPRSGVRRVDSSEMEAVKQCGERLFRAVFTDDVYASFLRSRDSALEEEKGLRVRLRIDVPEFHDYPWEFLYNAHLNQFLALSKDTPVVRYLELPYPVQPLTVQPPLKILVMISSPEGFPKLNVEDEWKRLSNALAPLLRRGLVTLERLKSPTLSALQQHLRRGEYHIFHFVGHGTFSEHKQDGMLLLEEENGRGRPVSGQYLGTVLHDHRSLRLVVLNACEGARTSQEDPYAGVAQTLVLQGIPAVIAMQFEIVETAAITFAQEFYGAVADGFPVDAAVSEARKAIFATGNDVEWGTPVLYMRTPQGVIFEIPEAQRVRQTFEDEPIPYIDKELEQKLEQLYTEGLAAFWVEDWDKACDRFQKILADRPDHAAAADKLAEAKRQRNLANLYARAAEAQGAENWPMAQKTLEELLKDSPEYKDASTTLKMVKKKKRLAELYAEAKQLHAAKKWQAVAKVFSQIKSIDPDYPDAENLLATAEKELEELKRQAELNELYSQAVHAIDAGHWEKAQGWLGQVQEMESDFLETEKLLSKVESKIRQSREEQKRRDQINTLYEQAHGLLRSKKWRPALDKIEEIIKLDEQFEDPEKIAERAQKELSREEQEAERQNELAAMYAEAVRLLREEKYQEALEKWQEIKSVDSKYPDRQRVQRTARKSLAALAKPETAKRKIVYPKSLWLWIGAVFIVAIVISGMILIRNKEYFDSTIYDDFDKLAYDGSYNTDLWRSSCDSGKIFVGNDKIYQSDGVMFFSTEKNDGWCHLTAKAYSHYKINEPISFETKLSLTSEGESGVFMEIKSTDNKFIFGCGITSSPKWHVRCYQQDYNIANVKEYTESSWQTFRITVIPATREIIYYVDNEIMGSYSPSDANTFSDNQYDFVIGGYMFSSGNFKGLVDDVRMGELSP